MFLINQTLECNWHNFIIFFANTLVKSAYASLMPILFLYKKFFIWPCKFSFLSVPAPGGISDKQPFSAWTSKLSISLVALVFKTAFSLYASDPHLSLNCLKFNETSWAVGVFILRSFAQSLGWRKQCRNSFKNACIMDFYLKLLWELSELHEINLI